MLPLLPPAVARVVGTTLCAIGSRATCNPPPTDTDEDFLAYSGPRRRTFGEAYSALEAAGWSRDCGREYEAADPSKFRSYRKGRVNLILTLDLEFYERFVLATEVCRRLNLMRKEDRILVCQAVREGVLWPAPN